MSRTMESAVTVITVPSRPWPPGSFLREWLFSYSVNMSLKDSTGSAAAVASGASVFGVAVSDEFGSGVFGLDMRRLKPLAAWPRLGYHWRGMGKDFAKLRCRLISVSGV